MKAICTLNSLVSESLTIGTAPDLEYLVLLDGNNVLSPGDIVFKRNGALLLLGGVPPMKHSPDAYHAIRAFMRDLRVRRLTPGESFTVTIGED
jgi:hypothetical protein